MVREATSTEYLLARQTAEEYRCRGYEVSQGAPLDFMPGFNADLIARKGDETKVIEVKSRTSLAAIPELAELARIIDSKPGWTFELLLVGEPEKLESPEGTQSLDKESVLQRIEEAEEILDAGQFSAAFVLAWSAWEAAARALISEEGITDSAIVTSEHVLEQAIHLGVISRAEHKHMSDLRKVRNAIVHGYRVDDFDDDLALNLIANVRRLTGTVV